MKKIFVVIAIILSVLLASSCQKDKMLEGTWVQVLPERTMHITGAKYEFAVFSRNGTVTVWCETAERLILDRHVYNYIVVGGTHVTFLDYDLWYRDDGVLGGSCGGESVIFYRQ